MEIGVPLKELGDYDINPLQDTILSLSESSWFGNQYRQLKYEVHEHTQSIVMVFTDGSNWPNIEVSREAGWNLLAKHAVPLMHQILKDHYPLAEPLFEPWPRDWRLAVSSNLTMTHIRRFTIAIVFTFPSTLIHESAL